MISEPRRQCSPAVSVQTLRREFSYSHRNNEGPSVADKAPPPDLTATSNSGNTESGSVTIDR